VLAAGLPGQSAQGGGGLGAEARQELGGPTLDLGEDGGLLEQVVDAMIEVLAGVAGGLGGFDVRGAKPWAIRR
jgi:hypothetical protein